ncbi:MAG: SUMF1/EgtB/PvdO family nonheme iron enzyme [Myxococcales bacterium]|jgi:formylglycine-generating enzyme required for sulfatase activity|nr:SUMF1/EgtB/PvdO family nonheme iron enzyme [Myxococcales bacterium]
MSKIAGLGLLWLLGCEGVPPASSSGMLPCNSDDDCASQAMLRACVSGSCADPGCPLGTVYVGSGSFSRGCGAGEPDCEISAQPLHSVRIDHSLCISATELSVAQYRACGESGACPLSTALRCTPDLATWTDRAGPFEALPMTCLLWSEAAAACRFLGGRLPTEAEWEKAARGLDRRRYPWGNVQPLGCTAGINYAGGGSCPGVPWPATTAARQGAQRFSASRAFDMAGNVWEWVTDYYSATAYQECQSGCTDPLGPVTGVVRSRRGGSFSSSQFKELTTFWRDFHTPEAARSDNQGARCVFPR